MDLMKADLIDMVETSFGSVWALELLLILHREPDRGWTADALVRELRSSDLVVAQSVEVLSAGGFIVVQNDGTIRYGPVSEAQGRLVRDLAAEYRVKPAAIRRLIIHTPADKLRSFAEAFKLKKS